MSNWYATKLTTAVAPSQPIGVWCDTVTGDTWVCEGNSLSKYAPNGTKTVVAGNGVSGFADGQGSAARFASPRGLARDAAGNFYVADGGNNRIRKVAPDGTVTTVAGTGTAAATATDGAALSATFSQPYGVALDPAGNLYITEQNGFRVRKLDTAGQVTTVAGSPTGAPGSANGTGTAATFNVLYHCAITPDGKTLYVADNGNDQIRAVDLATKVVTTYAASTRPAGVAVHPVNGMVYATNNGGTGNRVVEISKPVTPAYAGSAATAYNIAGSGSAGNTLNQYGTAASFNAPNGLAFNKAGELVLADYSNNQLVRLVPQGIILRDQVITEADSNTITVTVPASAQPGDQLLVRLSHPVPNGTTVPQATTCSDPGMTLLDQSVSAAKIILAETWGKFVGPGDAGKSLTFTVPAAVTSRTVVYLGVYGNASTQRLFSLGTLAAGNNSSTVSFNYGPTNLADTNGLAVLLGTAATTSVSLSTTAFPTGFAYRGQVNTSSGGAHVLGVVDGKPANAATTYTWSIASGQTSSEYLTHAAVIPPQQGDAADQPATVTVTSAGHVFTLPHGYGVDPGVTTTVPNASGRPGHKGTAALSVTTSVAAATPGVKRIPAVVSPWRLATTAATALFTITRGVAVDPAGNVYLAGEGGTYSGCIVKITPDGTQSVFAGSTPGFADGPALGGAQFSSKVRGMVFDPAGNLYVCDVGNFRIRKIDTAGNVTTFAGTGASGRVNATLLTSTFNDENSISIDDSGCLWVSSQANTSVRKLDPVADAVTMPSSGGSQPTSHVISPDGAYIYITYAGLSSLYRYTVANGAFGAIVDGPFSLATAVTIDRNSGLLYVGTSHQRVWQVIPPTSNYTTWNTVPIAGTDATSGNVDGPTGPNATGSTKLVTPQVMCYDPIRGDVHFGQADGRARKLAPQGVTLRAMAFNTTVGAVGSVTIPAGVRAGDQLVVKVVATTVSTAATTVPVTCSDPNLTLLASDVDANPGFLTGYVYTKVAVAGDAGATVTFTFSASDVNNVVVELAAYDNASTHLPARIGQTWTGTSGTIGQFTATGTPTDNGGLVVLLGSGYPGAQWSPTAIPGGFLFRGQIANKTAGLNQWMGLADGPAPIATGSYAWSTVSGNTGLLDHAVIVPPPQGTASLTATVTLAATGFGTGGQIANQNGSGGVDPATTNVPAAAGTPGHVGSATTLSTTGVPVADGVAVKHQLGTVSLTAAATLAETGTRNRSGTTKAITATVTLGATGTHHIGTSEVGLPVAVTFASDGFTEVTWAAHGGEFTATATPATVGAKGALGHARTALTASTRVDAATGERQNVVEVYVALDAAGTAGATTTANLPVRVTARAAGGKGVAGTGDLPAATEVDGDGGVGTLLSARLWVTTDVAVAGAKGGQGTPWWNDVIVHTDVNVVPMPHFESDIVVPVTVDLLAGTLFHQVNGIGVLIYDGKKIKLTVDGGTGRARNAAPVTAKVTLGATGFALIGPMPTALLIVTVALAAVGAPGHSGPADEQLVVVDVDTAGGLAGRFGLVDVEAGDAVDEAGIAHRRGVVADATAAIDVSAGAGAKADSGLGDIEVVVDLVVRSEPEVLAFTRLGITGRALEVPPGHPQAATTPAARLTAATTSAARLTPTRTARSTLQPSIRQ